MRPGVREAVKRGELCRVCYGPPVGGLDLVPVRGGKAQHGTDRECIKALRDRLERVLAALPQAAEPNT